MRKNKIYQKRKALFSLGVSTSIKAKGQTKRCSEVGNINIQSTGSEKKRQHLIFMNIRLNLNSQLVYVPDFIQRCDFCQPVFIVYQIVLI